MDQGEDKEIRRSRTEGDTMRTSFKSWACCTLLLGSCLSVEAVEYRLDRFGQLNLGDGLALHAQAYPKGWNGPSGVPTMQEMPNPRTGEVRWQFKAGNRKIGTGTSCALKLADGRVMYRLSVTMDEDYETEGLVCALSFPEKLLKGATIGNGDAKTEKIPDRFDKLFVFDDGCGRVEINGAKRNLTFDLPRGTWAMLQDDRKWCASFTLRMRFGGRRLEAGRTYATMVLVGGESVDLTYDEPYVITAGSEWLPLDFRKDVVKGSAADFSHFGFRDAPAGKYGWLKNDHGSFVFEKRPGEKQRFMGVNFCGALTCPEHADAEMLVSRLEKAGYNSIRIHHYESSLVKDSPDRLTLNPERIDRFDYLFAKAKEKGFYFTTDVYVSRPVDWRDIGIDRDGRVDMSLVKGLFMVHEPAFENWKAFARNLLLHRNPYTGMTYAEDPAMPFISLVNEGVFAWRRGVFDEEPTRKAWTKWLAEVRAKNPGCYPKAPADCLGHGIDEKGSRENGIYAFMSEMENRFTIRARDYLRSIGVKAMLTDWNCGPYPDGGAVPNNLDYVDMHFYVDHPSFLGGRWALPAELGNSNPSKARWSMSCSMGLLADKAGVPYTVSEWNFTAPNACRGASGLLTGVCAARHDWDALWRFDYAGSAKALGEGDAGISYFQVGQDPFMTAAERATVLLYLRRECAPLDRQEDIAGGYKFPIEVDQETGRFSVATAFTAGGFGMSGDAVAAGPLTCQLVGTQATLWASAVDGKPLVDSNRILLTHLTDLKTDGITFADSSCRILQSWGSKRLIVRTGSAAVALALNKPETYAVWGLETDGTRREKLPATVKDGKLCFTVDVKNAADRARLLYEIARQDLLH